MYACTCQVDKCALCSTQLFSALAAPQACRIQDMLTHRRYAPRAPLFHQGEPCTRLFALRRGQVKLTSSLPDGREQIIGLRVPGQLLGVETLDDKVYPYTAVTLAPVDACQINHRDMLDLLAHDPEVAVRVIRRLNEELGEAQALIRDLGLKTAPERVASFILSLMPLGDPRTGQVPLPLSRLEISELLGLTEETVSRVLTRFKRLGITHAPRGRVHILDPARLGRLAAGADGDVAPT